MLYLDDLKNLKASVRLSDCTIADERVVSWRNHG